MRSLQRFAETVTHARKLFYTRGGVHAWLEFYEAKQRTYAELVRTLPQVKEIQDFWRYVKNMPVTQWLPIIEAQVERITRKRSVCHDCAAVEISWPEHLCPECKKARRLESYRKAKERARIKQRMRKCPRCKIEPLDRRQKVCCMCKANARRDRNRRYQEGRKEAAIRRVQPEFTREGTSTIPISQPVTVSVRNVAPEAVLPGGVT